VLAVDEGLPTSVADTHEWLRRLLTENHARLDETGKARPEGVVRPVPTGRG
jgi:hypothetical protein